MTHPTQAITSRKPGKYGTVSYVLTVLCILLLTVVLLAAGALWLMYRADARVALGNAKTVRIALNAASTEAYAAGEPFADPSQPGGVTEDVLTEVLIVSNAPGNIQLIQTEDNGYGVARFAYTEGAFTVVYTADPTTWEVCITPEILHAVP